MPRETREEKEVLDTYGGEIIFTPGDIVYSSSKLIEASPPNLAHEKLLTLLEAEQLTFDHLRRALDGFASIDVHVIGDTIVDTYTQTAMIGGQTKTPTMSVRFEGQEDFVGGAGVVAKHLKAAGANVTFSTVLGDDKLGGVRARRTCRRPASRPRRSSTRRARPPTRTPSSAAATAC